MKNTFLIIVGILLVAVMGVQGYYTYLLSEKVDKLSSLKVNLLGFRNKTLANQEALTQSEAESLAAESEEDTEAIDDNQYPLAGWEPFTEFQQLQEKMNRVWSDSYSRFTLNPKFNESVAESQFSPNVDFTETDQYYRVQVDMPGAKETSIQVLVQDQQLHISAQTEKQSVVDNQQGQPIRNERLFGVFERTLGLPALVNPEAMETTYEHGVLTIVLPKAAVSNQ